jgi:hypothetical protein
VSAHQYRFAPLRLNRNHRHRHRCQDRP